MRYITTTLFGLGALAAVSCGSPDELDESQFPELTATGYDATGGANTSMVVGAAGAPATGGGAAIVSPSAAGGAPPIAGGVAGTSGTSGGTASPGASGACPNDITLLFNRPIEQGGCAGTACHIPGVTRPDLVSPNPQERLLDVTSECNGLSYIGASAEDSLLALKITEPPDGCGFTMPFFQPQALSAEDEACILAWIDEISGG